MAGYRQRSKNRHSASTALMAAFVVACVVVFGYFSSTGPDPVRLDPDTLCPEDRSLIPHLEVLLFERNRRVDFDTREFVPVSPNTVTEIRRQIEQGLSTLPKHSLVGIYEVEYTRSERFEPAASFCNPGDGSEISEWTGNPRLAALSYRERFREPFLEVVTSLSAWSPDHKYSLVDTLGAVARLVFGDPEFEHATKTLTVVSDFVTPQNFAAGGRIPSSFSQVNNSTPLGSLDDFAAAGGLRFDFRGAHVRLIVNRMKYVTIPDVQGPAHTAWWERFFDAQNATVEEVVPVGEW